MKTMNVIRNFLCRIGWHCRPFIVTGFDGASSHASCPHCGFAGMIDSQGNLF
jgi:hypothetical protein